MGWMGPWLGGGGSGAPAAAPAAAGGSGPLDRVLRVLKAEFPEDADEPVATSLAVVTEAGDAVVALQIAEVTVPGTGQTIRVTVQIHAQSDAAAVTRRIHDRALNALFAAPTVSVISHTVGADYFDEETGERGVYRRVATLEIRW